MTGQLDAPGEARHPVGMPIHLDWDRTGLPAVPHDYRGPLIAFVVALALAFVARIIRSGALAAATGGAGVLAGWWAITGRLWATSPRASVDHLPLVAAVTLVVGVLCTRLDRNRGALPGLILAAVFTGWWLCGAPRDRPDLLQVWPIGLGVGVAVVVYARSLATDTPDTLRLTPLRLALTGLTMAASFHVVMLPPMWLQLAIVPALASLALFALPAMSGPAALPIAADIAAVGSLAVMEAGRLPRLRVGAVDVAAVAPLLALWLAPHLAGRLRVAGRAASVSASVLAALIATAAVWIAMRALGR